MTPASMSEIAMRLDDHITATRRYWNAVADLL